MDILDNVIPNIGGEEDKVEWEPRKMLGRFADGEINLADFAITAHTNRVAVSDGHMVCLSVELRDHADVRRVTQALRGYQAPEESCDLPSAPRPVIVVRDEPDRPQPRLDRLTGRGMTSVVGRVRPDPIFDVKLVVLSHNTIRGGAGGSVLNAELALAKKLL
jgi:aspartate-semialdehyde dehydrogenase